MQCIIIASMIYEYSSYSSYLKEMLVQRKQANKAYSLRAMAKNLNLSASTLSDVINGHKHFSERTASEVASRLGLRDRQAKYFHALVQFESSKNEEFRFLLSSQLKVLNPKLREHFAVHVDEFRFMADWYHTAILELTYLPNQKMDELSIADTLGITPTQARDAVALLLKLGLLEVDESTCTTATYKKTKKQFQFQSQKPNQALRKFHQMMLEKAKESLFTQSPQEKLVGSETLPIGIQDLAQVNDIIENCFQQILELSKKSQNKSHVYHLGIQFFRLTQQAKPQQAALSWSAEEIE